MATVTSSSHSSSSSSSSSDTKSALSSVYQASTSADGSDVYPAVVIDNGSLMIKAGFSGDDAPRAVFPTVVGRPRHVGIMVGMGQKEVWVGDDALYRRSPLQLSYPIRRGVFNDTQWYGIEKIWHHTFYNELRVAPEEYPLIMTESIINPRAHREKITEIVFEQLGVPCFFLAQQAVLSLFASGRTSGIVIDSGDTTSAVPIYEGSAIPYAMSNMIYGGNDITDAMMVPLQFNTSSEREIARDIKEKLGFISLNYDNELKDSKAPKSIIQKNYELPDGQMITVGAERFQYCEGMFQPYLLGNAGNSNRSYAHMHGIHTMCYNAIIKCDIDIRKELYGNIVLSGGGTMISGLDERLTSEMKTLSPPQMNIKVVAPPERKYTTWIGGSILGTLSTMSTQWITKEEYDETGASMIHRKCL